MAEPAEFADHPYAVSVRALLDRDETQSARALLAAALRVVGPHRTLLDLSKVLAKPRVGCVPRTDADRTREYRWIKQHGDAYRGQWVAVLGDELVASARSFRELRARLGTCAPAGAPLVERID